MVLGLFFCRGSHSPRNIDRRRVKQACKDKDDVA